MARGIPSPLCSIPLLHARSIPFIQQPSSNEILREQPGAGEVLGDPHTSDEIGFYTLPAKSVGSRARLRRASWEAADFPAKKGKDAAACSGGKRSHRPSCFSDDLPLMDLVLKLLSSVLNFVVLDFCM
jgi:hypothetical protein